MLISEKEFHKIVRFIRMNEAITYSISDISDLQLFVCADA